MYFVYVSILYYEIVIVFFILIINKKYMDRIVEIELENYFF